MMQAAAIPHYYANDFWRLAGEYIR